MVQTSKIFSFTFRKAKDLDSNTGTGTPPPPSFKRAAATIFLPLSSTHPQYDLLIRNAKGSKLLGFQKWRFFCSANADLVEMECYWVIPEQCIGGDYAACSDNVIFFEDLYEDFPALRALSLE